MKQWNGLLKKEWALMSSQFYATVGGALLFSILLPFCSTLFNWGLKFLEVSLVLSGVWLVAGLLIPTIILLISVGKETSRPDIWLHSKASIFKLFGSKAIFAGFVGAVNMGIPILVVIIGSRFPGFLVDLSLMMIVEVGVLLFLSLCIMSLLILCTGLFFGVLYQLIKPFVKGFAGPIIVVLFFLTSWVVDWAMKTTFYEKIVTFGPSIGPRDGVINLVKDNFYLEVETSIVSTGQLLVDLLVAVVLFTTAALLFEKKVRI